MQEDQKKKIQTKMCNVGELILLTQSWVSGKRVKLVPWKVNDQCSPLSSPVAEVPLIWYHPQATSCCHGAPVGLSSCTRLGIHFMLLLLALCAVLYLYVLCCVPQWQKHKLLPSLSSVWLGAALALGHCFTGTWMLLIRMWELKKKHKFFFWGS